MKAKSLLMFAAVAVLAAWGMLLLAPASAPAQAFDRAVARLRQAGGTGSEETHKCVSGTRVEYSSAKCPAGSIERPMGGGSMTVVPAATLPKPASAPASVPTVRDLLAPASGPDLLDERIKRATGG